MKTNEMMKILASHNEGKVIEYKHKDTEGYWRPVKEPCWNFAKFSYRVKVCDNNAKDNFIKEQTASAYYFAKRGSDARGVKIMFPDKYIAHSIARAESDWERLQK